MASKPNTIRSRSRSRTRVPQPIVIPAKNTLNDILNTLECPICLDHFSSQIFMCKFGHNVCEDCKNKLTNPICPLCRSIITGQRNFSLEEIASKCSTKCPNSEDGCTYVGSKEKIEYHTPKCSFQRYLCPLGVTYKQCQWKGLYSEIILHFQTNHPNNMAIKSGMEVKFPNFDVTFEDRDLQLITLGKNMCFLYHVQIDPKNNVANWAVQKIGTEKVADKFHYEFIFHDYNKNIKITNTCRSNGISLTSLFESGNCVSIPLNVLKNYVNNRKELSFRMFIRSNEDVNALIPKFRQII